nr:MAG TPA: hypothetical protein [Crassvirales sp.]
MYYNLFPLSIRYLNQQLYLILSHTHKKKVEPKPDLSNSNHSTPSMNNHSNYKHNN